MCVFGIWTGEWSFFGTGDGFNIVKFFLGVNSIFFDLIFMFQHFVLYWHSEDDRYERHLELLAESEEETKDLLAVAKKQPNGNTKVHDDTDH